MSRRLSPEIRAKIVELARSGMSRLDIAIETGASETSIRKYAGEHLRPRPGKDLARYRRLIAACESAERGGRSEIAARFGFSGTNSLKVRLSQARRIIAEARA